MNAAAARLLTYTDFTSFSKVDTDAKTNICHLTQAVWQPLGDDRWRFVISADRFLRNMVRAIVGTLLEVGRHRLTVDDFCRIIECKDRCAAGESAPACALALVDITYPDEVYRPIL
jgi:tRNA pseudouridine38-40 synthase